MRRVFSFDIWSFFNLLCFGFRYRDCDFSLVSVDICNFDEVGNRSMLLDIPTYKIYCHCDGDLVWRMLSGGVFAITPGCSEWQILKTWSWLQGTLVREAEHRQLQLLGSFAGLLIRLCVFLLLLHGFHMGKEFFTLSPSYPQDDFLYLSSIVLKVRTASNLCFVVGGWWLTPDRRGLLSSVSVSCQLSAITPKLARASTASTENIYSHTAPGSSSRSSNLSQGNHLYRTKSAMRSWKWQVRKVLNARPYVQTNLNNNKDGRRTTRMSSSRILVRIKIDQQDTTVLTVCNELIQWKQEVMQIDPWALIDTCFPPQQTQPTRLSALFSCGHETPYSRFEHLCGKARKSNLHYSDSKTDNEFSDAFHTPFSHSSSCSLQPGDLPPTIYMEVDPVAPSCRWDSARLGRNQDSWLLHKQALHTRDKRRWL